MILWKILITNKWRITNNGIEMRILSKLFLAIREKVSRFNSGGVCCVHCKNAFYSFLRFFWIKLYAPHKMGYHFSLRTALDQSFYSRGENNAVTTTRLQDSRIRRLYSPVGEEISNRFWRIIAAA